MRKTVQNAQLLTIVFLALLAVLFLTIFLLQQVISDSPEIVEFHRVLKTYQTNGGFAICGNFKEILDNL